MNNFRKIDPKFISEFFYNDYTPNTSSKSQIICDLLKEYDNPILDCILETDPETDKKLIKYNSLDKDYYSTYRTLSPVIFSSEVLKEINNELNNEIKKLPEIDNNTLLNIKDTIENKLEEYQIEEEIINGNIKEAVNSYNSIYKNENSEVAYADVNWKERTLYERAAIISEYYSKHPNENISTYIEAVHENPEIVNTKENLDIINNIPKNSKQRLALMYNTFAVNFEIELVPPKYIIESYFIKNENEKNNLLTETKYCDNKETLYEYAQLLDSHYKTHLLSEIRTNDKEKKLLYEVSKEKNVNYIEGIYFGKIDAKEFTRIYNKEKNYKAESLNENVSESLLKYLDSKNITVYENITTKEKTSFTIKDNNGNSESGDITKIFDQAVFCAINDRIKQIQKNHNDKEKHLFADEDCILFDKIKALSESLKDNFINGQNEKYHKNEERIKTLKKQNDYLSINNIIFERNYNQVKGNNTLNIIDARTISGLTKEQVQQINDELIKKAEQMKKINEITKTYNKGNKI